MRIENLEDADGSAAEDVSELYKCNIYGYPTEKEDEMDSLQDSSVGKKVYTQTQLQCEQISQIAQGIL